MNKQELINHIKDQNEWSGNHRFILIKKEELIFMIEDLDQPQKVKARLAKHWDEDLGDCLWWNFPVEEPPYCGTPLDDDFPKYKTHFTELHIPDEVEEEQKYRVEFPQVETNGNKGAMYLINYEGKIFITTDGSFYANERYIFTEQEIKSIDERYWPFAVPVEKV